MKIRMKIRPAQSLIKGIARTISKKFKDIRAMLMSKERSLEAF